MYNCIVSNAHIISNNSAGLQVSTVYNGAILHIYLVAHAYNVHIATQNGIKPYTAVVAHHHIANNGGVGGNIAVVSKGWQYSFNW